MILFEGDDLQAEIIPYGSHMSEYNEQEYDH